LKDFRRRLPDSCGSSAIQDAKTRLIAVDIMFFPSLVEKPYLIPYQKAISTNVSFAAPIFSGNRPIFFEAATEALDIEKIACMIRKMFFIPGTIVFWSFMC
jgi:hypothetical protein